MTHPYPSAARAAHARPPAAPARPLPRLLAALWLALLLALPAAGLRAQALPHTFAGGQEHSLSIHADGTLWATGNNTYGQLGIATTTASSSAWVQVGTATNWVMVAAGAYHSLGLRADGSLYTWGLNNDGQLGSAINNGTGNANPTPALVAGTYTQVAAGAYHSLGLRADGSLYAWGYNTYGQLGSAINNGTTNNANPTPALVAGTYTQVAAGAYHSLGLQADGSLYAWGRNYYGQLGSTANNGTITANPAPAATGRALVTRSLSMGSNFGLAVRGDGTLWAWGDNTYGQLGIATTTASTTRPVQVGTATDWVMVAAGYSHSLGLRANGSLYAWGSNQSGQLGNATNNGTGNANPTPALVAGTYTQVAAGAYHSLGLRADGSLYAWGYNYFGQLGSAATSGTGNANPTPALVAGTYTQVAAGDVHSLGLGADGSLYAWGSNRYGQLGSAANSGTNNANPAPALVAGTYTQVAAGQYHSLGLRADGSLYAWGYNYYGQLGSAANSGTTNANPTPALVAGTYTQVAAGVSHSLGLRADGSLYTWGRNYFGQLGSAANSGTDNANPTPTQEATRGTDWTTLGTGSTADFSLVRTPSAQSFASAGSNSAGQLGDGTTTNANRFDRVSPLRSLQPLPVELTAFTATAAGSAAVRLAWATASEKNSAAFEVERSQSGTGFERIGTVAAAGTSSSPRSYELPDAQLPADALVLYYRLKQVDADGRFSYSSVRTVALTPPLRPALTLFPNPAPAGPGQRAATLTGMLPGTPVTVLDALGRPVLAATADAAGTAALALPAGLPAGVYVVRAGSQALRLSVE